MQFVVPTTLMIRPGMIYVINMVFMLWMKLILKHTGLLEYGRGRQMIRPTAWNGQGHSLIAAVVWYCVIKIILQ